MSWLKSESFSSAQILAEVIGTGVNAAYKTLRSMERDNLVQPQKIEIAFGAIVVWGITSHGSALAVDPLAAQTDWTHFEPGRLSPLTIAHHLDVQKVRLHHESMGWRGWTSERQCRQLNLIKVPDAIATNQSGQLVAIEVERTIKTQKRYAQIISAYLQSITRGTLSHVQYVSPVPGVSARLERLFSDIKAVPVQGNQIPLEAVHRQKFSFLDFSKGA